MARYVSNYMGIISGDNWLGHSTLRMTKTPVFLTYSFPKTMTKDDRTSWPEDASTWRPFSDQDKAAAKAALSQWGKACGITFLETKGDHGDIQFSWIPSGQTAFAYRPSNYYPYGPEEFTYFYESAGNVYLNPTYEEYFSQNPTQKNLALLHEIGHAIGLKHPFSTTDLNPRLLSKTYDSLKYTVMAYSDPEEPIPATLRPFDIQAARKLYGPPSADGKQVSKWHWSRSKEVLTQIGKSKADVMLGTSVTDIMKGQDGDDRLHGLKGNDELYGGLGNDVLIGGPGKDSFVFDTQPQKEANVDKIVDFAPEEDRIVLSSAIFSEAGPAGRLSESAFAIGSSAKDAASRLIFDYRYSFALYYDPDGTGARPQIKIATVNDVSMNASHFLIV